MINVKYPYKLFSLKNRIILITGGYGLLGKEFAKTIVSAGAQVIISGRNILKAKQVSEELGGWAVELDVKNKSSVMKAINEIVNKYGTIDGLINNASYSFPASESAIPFQSFEEFDEEIWEEALATDIKGMFLCAQTVGKIMKKNKSGVIVNVSSIYGTLAPDQRIYDKIIDADGKQFIKPVAYCVAKGAVMNFTRYLATYWAGCNIRVNTLTLGGVFDNQNQSFVESYNEKTTLGRMANQDEYNGAILFLLSDASSYMTGANLIIDGGWSAW